MREDCWKNDGAVLVTSCDPFTDIRCNTYLGLINVRCNEFRAVGVLAVNDQSRMDSRLRCLGLPSEQSQVISQVDISLEEAGCIRTSFDTWK